MYRGIRGATFAPSGSRGGALKRVAGVAVAAPNQFGPGCRSSTPLVLTHPAWPVLKALQQAPKKCGTVGRTRMAAPDTQSTELQPARRISNSRNPASPRVARARRIISSAFSLIHPVHGFNQQLAITVRCSSGLRDNVVFGCLGIQPHDMNEFVSQRLQACREPLNFLSERIAPGV